MPRTTRKELRDSVDTLRDWGFDVTIHWAYGRPRITSSDLSVDISPRLSMGEMKEWINGFTKAVMMTSNETPVMVIDKSPLELELEHETDS